MAARSPLTLSQLVLTVVAIRLAAIVLAAIVIRALPEHAHDAASTALIASREHNPHDTDPLRDMRLRD